MKIGDKSFHDKSRLKGFMTNYQAPQWMLEGYFSLKGRIDVLKRSLEINKHHQDID